jgi:hypothetical protein
MMPMNGWANPERSIIWSAEDQVAYRPDDDGAPGAACLLMIPA